MSSDLHFCVVFGALGLVLGLALLGYRRAPGRDAPDDAEAVRDYVAEQQRRQRYAGIVVILLSAGQFAVLFAHFS